jgi:formylglycine-generating enzyme required for sulfatase activity
MAAVEIARQDTDPRIKMLENHWMNPRWQEVILLAAGELDQRGNKQALETFLLHILHLEEAARGSLLAGRALADVGVRRVKDTITEGIRVALKHTMWDADTDGRPFAQARVPIDQRASAADTLDELGYLPDDLYDFAPVEQIAPSTSLRTSNLFIAKHPVTNLQYERFLKSPDFAEERFWLNFPKYDENGKPMKETWGKEGLEWLRKNQQDKDDSPDGKVILPRYWTDPRFGIARRTAPVVGVTWWEANAYCKWIMEHGELPEREAMTKLVGKQNLAFRLPTENEWVLAAGGLGKPLVTGKGKEKEEYYRFPWDEDENVTPSPKSKDDPVMVEILRRANIYESGINRTTPAGMYPLGRTKNGLWDIGGNVWEWQANYLDKDHDVLGLRGGSWGDSQGGARVSPRFSNPPYGRWNGSGFRVVAFSPPM